jgi:hypothetical protein
MCKPAQGRVFRQGELNRESIETIRWRALVEFD